MNILIDDIRLFFIFVLAFWCKKNKLSWEIEHDIFICC